MDPKDQKAGAATVETGGNQGVNTDTSGQPAPADQKDAEAALAEATARIAKLSEERDNYKRGMLKAKGKLKEDDDNDEDAPDLREIVKQETLAILAETDLVKATLERDELISKMAKENKELKLAISNRPGTGTSVGGNSDAQKPKDNVISEDQERTLRAQGWDDAKIEYFKALASK